MRKRNVVSLFFCAITCLVLATQSSSKLSGSGIKVFSGNFLVGGEFFLFFLPIFFASGYSLRKSLWFGNTLSLVPFLMVTILTFFAAVLTFFIPAFVMALPCKSSGFIEVLQCFEDIVRLDIAMRGSFIAPASCVLALAFSFSSSGEYRNCLQESTNFSPLIFCFVFFGGLTIIFYCVGKLVGLNSFLLYFISILFGGVFPSVYLFSMVINPFFCEKKMYSVFVFLCGMLFAGFVANP